jgi:solute carrier family 25 phosphate transporter 3
MAKFFFFEGIVQMFYTHVFTAPKESYSKGTQLGVTFASGYLAGVVCAIVSHPADSLVSQMGKASNKGKSLGQIAGEVGWSKLATSGLGTRVIMIGTLTGKKNSRYWEKVSDSELVTQASNGGSTIPSRLLWEWAPPVESRL